MKLIIQRSRGFTLVELVISMVIIAIGLSGTLIVINSVVKRSGDPMVIYQAVAIAESYLEEISSKAFPTNMPCSSAQPVGGRVNYYNVCDYKYIAAAGEVPTDQTGNAIAGLGSYNVKVNIDDTGASLGALTAAANQVVRIDVTVSNPNGPTMTYSVYRTNY